MELSDTQAAHPLPICLSRLWVPDVEWGRHMSAEPSMPPTGSTNNEFLKGSTGWGGVESFFFFFFLPKPFCMISSLEYTLLNFQQLSAPLCRCFRSFWLREQSYCHNYRARIVLQLGGLGTYNAEQLTRWERPTDFCLFLYASMWGKLSVCFIYSVCSISNPTATESFTGYSVFTMNKMFSLLTLTAFEWQVFTVCETSIALLNEGRLSKTLMYF